MMAATRQQTRQRMKQSSSSSSSRSSSSSDDKYVDNCVVHDDKYTLDNRLFPGLPLYCEGRAKPYLRGKQHLVCCLFLIPLMTYTLLSKYTEARVEMISSMMFATGSMASMGASAMFHLSKFNVKQEIFFQRLDHSAVFVNVMFTYSSIALMVIHNAHILNSSDKTVMFNVCTACITITIAGSLFGVFHVFNHYTERMGLWVGNICLSLPSYPFISYHLTKNEQNLAIIGLASYAIGAIIFGKRLHQSRFPHIYTYHEVFHFFTVFSATCAYLMLLSLSQNNKEDRCKLRWASFEILFGHNGSFCDYE